jgi:hypothetical protein
MKQKIALKVKKKNYFGNFEKFNNIGSVGENK